MGKKGQLCKMAMSLFVTFRPIIFPTGYDVYHDGCCIHVSRFFFVFDRLYAFNVRILCITSMTIAAATPKNTILSTGTAGQSSSTLPLVPPLYALLLADDGSPDKSNTVSIVFRYICDCALSCSPISLILLPFI